MLNGVLGLSVGEFDIGEMTADFSLLQSFVQSCEHLERVIAAVSGPVDILSPIVQAAARKEQPGFQVAVGFFIGPGPGFVPELLGGFDVAADDQALGTSAR